MINKPVYERLKEVARKGKRNNKEGIIFYEDVMLLAGLDRENPADREIKLCEMLDTINRKEDEAGRHMITAVVVHKSDKMPGEGFFNLALDLGRWDGKGKRVKFWSDEIKQVWDCWSKR